MSLRRAVAAALIAFSILAPSGARADEAPARAIVTFPTCDAPPFDRHGVLELLRVELAAERVDVVEAERPGTGEGIARVRLDVEDCRAPREVLVTIEDALTRKRVIRPIDIADAPPVSRPRTLALAIAELLRASWLELASPDAPPPRVPVPAPVRASVLRHASAPPPSPPPALVPPPPPATRLYLLGALDTRLFPAFRSALAGARAGASLPLAPRVRLQLDAGGFGGGSFAGDADLAAALVGAQATLSGGEGALAVELGPRLEAGAAWTSANAFGNPARTTGSAPLVFASLASSVRLHLAPRLSTLVALAAGTSIHGIDVRTPEDRLGGLGGPFLGLALGVTYEL